MKTIKQVLENHLHYYKARYAWKKRPSELKKEALTGEFGVTRVFANLFEDPKALVAWGETLCGMAMIIKSPRNLYGYRVLFKAGEIKFINMDPIVLGKEMKAEKLINLCFWHSKLDNMLLEYWAYQGQHVCNIYYIPYKAVENKPFGTGRELVAWGGSENNDQAAFRALNPISIYKYREKAYTHKAWDAWYVSGHYHYQDKHLSNQQRRGAPLSRLLKDPAHLFMMMINDKLEGCPFPSTMEMRNAHICIIDADELDPVLQQHWERWEMTHASRTLNILAEDVRNSADSAA